MCVNDAREAFGPRVMTLGMPGDGLACASSRGGDQQSPGEGAAPHPATGSLDHVPKPSLEQLLSSV